MSVYFDASLIVSLFIQDGFTARADRYLSSGLPLPCVSDFAAAEFASAVNRLVRMKQLDADAGRAAFSAFDAWLGTGVRRIDTQGADIQSAETFLRRLDLPLRAPDALNIALADRAGAALATFDVAMAASATALGVSVINL
jgi:predicted nucleic acid-binding protein